MLKYFDNYNITMSYLNDLNDIQKEAVTFNGGHLLILAGAGSGKTRVLTTRIAHLINEGGVPPDRILAVTFTNKAAGEMKERITSLVGIDATKGLWLGTFHSIGLRLLRREAKHLDMDASAELSIYNDDDQLSLVKNIMKELGYNEKTFSPRAVLTRINGAKNENISPEEYLKSGGDYFTERAGRIYSLYQRRLKEMNALDFGDLICKPLELFAKRPDILANYQKRFLHVLVDEYQDTNRSQYMLLDILGKECGNICTVGDPDQSIYAWRGADIRNILDFEKDYHNSTVLRLEQNYRSTKTILSAANSVIKNNSSRLEKELWTDNSDGEKIEYKKCRDEHHEGSTVVDEVISATKTGRLKYSDMAVFYRTNSQSRVFEEHLMRASIPYNLIGGYRFYERKEIRDALSYLRITVNPKDSMSFQRVINTPARGIGKVAMENLWQIAKDTGEGLYGALVIATEKNLVKKKEAKELVEAIEGARKSLSESNGELHDIALTLLEDSGYMAMYIEEGSEDSLSRIENLHELITAIKDFEDAVDDATIGAFLDQVSLISDTDKIETDEDKTNKITLMTAHSAKGLEFDTVFMAGMEEGLFPHSRSIDDETQLEEERRLCYVGMTRAKKKLYIMSADTRRVYGEPRYQLQSRFIDEIDPSFLNITGDTGSFNSPHKDEYGSYKDPDDDYEYTDLDRPSFQQKPAGYSTLKDSTKIDYNDVSYEADHSQLDPYSEGLEFGDVWQRGMKVRHKNFGVGIINAVEGSGDKAKITVKFQKSGIKKLAVKFAGLEPA